MEMTSGGPHAVLEANELYRFYHSEGDETFALRGVSLKLDPGEMVAITGPSGSGKSTLLSCLAGLDEPDGGHVSVDAERLTRKPEVERAAIRARSVGVLLQTGNLLEPLSVIDNVRFAQRITGRVDSDRARALLQSVGLDDHTEAAPSSLSGGERARAGLAVALANEPKLLLADEPSGELDIASEATILSLLHGLADKGAAVLVVTHSERVSDRCDRVIELVDGRVS
jgi:putative ABC transport system ATP-binding protein